jgi:hypothetical protein
MKNPFICQLRIFTTFEVRNENGSLTRCGFPKVQRVNRASPASKVLASSSPLRASEADYSGSSTLLRCVHCNVHVKLARWQTADTRSPCPLPHDCLERSRLSVPSLMLPACVTQIITTFWLRPPLSCVIYRAVETPALPHVGGIYHGAGVRLRCWLLVSGRMA